MSTQIRPIRLANIETYRASQYVNPSANAKFEINHLNTKKKVKSVKINYKSITEDNCHTSPIPLQKQPQQQIVAQPQQEKSSEKLPTKNERVETKDNNKNFNSFQKFVYVTLRNQLKKSNS